MKTITMEKALMEGDWFLHFEYEDQLPEMSTEVYNRLFEWSRIVDGVRMFLYLLKNDLDWGERYYIE